MVEVFLFMYPLPSTEDKCISQSPMALRASEVLLERQEKGGGEFAFCVSNVGGGLGSGPLFHPLNLIIDFCPSLSA